MAAAILDNPSALAGALYMVAEQAIDLELRKLGKKYGIDMAVFGYTMTIDLHCLNENLAEVTRTYRVSKTKDWNIPNAVQGQGKEK